MNRNAILLAFGLTTAAALAPLSAQAGPIPAYQNWSCQKGSFLVGFKGHTGVWIDQMKPVCAPFNKKTGKLDKPVDGDIFGNINGGGPIEARAVCGAQQAVVRINFGRATPNGMPGHVQNLDVTCASIFNLAILDTWHPQMLSDNGVRKEGLPCYPGRIGYGIRIGLDGTNIAQLSLLCEVPSEIMHEAPGSGPFQHVPGVGGIGGGTIPSGTGVHPLPLPSSGNGPMHFPHHPGLPGGSTTPPPPPPPPVIGPSNIVTGTWKTTEGTIEFDYDGDELLGKYDDGGRLVLHKNHNGDWVGRWSEQNANHRCDDAKYGTHFWGEAVFTFTDKNRHFEGVWTYCRAKIPTGKPWIGDRIK